MPIKTVPKAQELIYYNLNNCIEHVNHLEELFQMTAEDSDIIQEVTIYAMEILDTNYNLVNISDVIHMHEYLTLIEKAKLKGISCKYEVLFNRILGTKKITLVNLELESRAMLHYRILY